MDRFEAMSLLLAVVDHGSLSAAGRERGVPVATLSRKLSDLERLLGTRLLIRTTRKLTLTDAGQTYVAAARRIIDQVEEAEREAAGEFVTPRGDLVLTAPVLFGRLHVLPVVADFLALFPDINIRLVQSDRNVDLVDDHVDMAVRIGRLSDSAMIATRVGTMRSIVCASPALLAGHGIPQSPLDIARLPSIAIGPPHSLQGWRFREAESSVEFEVAVAPRLTVTTAAAAVDATIRGVGITRLLHYQAATAIRAGALSIILEAFEPEPAPIHLIHVSRGQMPLKMRRFLDFAAPRLRDSVAALAETGGH
jgi:DNA-binding transcriptional LysR family regulator